MNPKETIGREKQARYSTEHNMKIKSLHFQSRVNYNLHFDPCNVQLGSSCAEILRFELKIGFENLRKSA